jgi:hypothetical protein
MIANKPLSQTNAPFQLEIFIFDGEAGLPVSAKSRARP